MGFLEGLNVGLAVGFFVGLTVGLAVGFFVGLSVGLVLGLLEGLSVGLAVGLALGLLEGLSVGLAVGFLEGLSVGMAVGFFVGLEVGGATTSISTLAVVHMSVPETHTLYSQIAAPVYSATGVKTTNPPTIAHVPIVVESGCVTISFNSRGRSSGCESLSSTSVVTGVFFGVMLLSSIAAGGGGCTSIKTSAVSHLPSGSHTT